MISLVDKFEGVVKFCYRETKLVQVDDQKKHQERE